MRKSCLERCNFTAQNVSTSEQHFAQLGKEDIRVISELRGIVVAAYLQMGFLLAPVSLKKVLQFRTQYHRYGLKPLLGATCVRISDVPNGVAVIHCGAAALILCNESGGRRSHIATK